MDVRAARHGDSGSHHAPSPQQLAASLLASHDLINAIDVDGRFTWWNLGCELLYGWTAEEVLGQPVQLYVPDDERGQLDLILRAMRQGEDVPPVETVRLTRDGRRIWVSLRISALRDDTGRIIGGLSMGRDITLEVRCREEVEAQRNHLRARLDHTAVAHATLTPDGRYSYANEAYCRLLGRPHDEVMGQPVLAFSCDQDMGRNASLVQELASGRREAMAEPRRVRRPDGTVVDVLVHASTIRAADGEVSGVALTLQDVTDLVQVRSTLAATRARWSAFSRHAVDVGFLAEPDGTLTSVSEALGERFGYTSQQVLGRKGWDVFHPDDVTPARAAWDRVVSGEVDRVCLEGRIRHADGRWMWVEQTVIDLRADPRVGSIVATVHDISARKAAELRLGELSLHDQLTGLANRALLLDRVTQAIERSRQGAGDCVLLLLDLDDFSLVNERMGHAAGDEVLVGVSQLLAAVLDALDTLARVEADTFAVLIEDVGDHDQVQERARELQTLLSAGVGGAAASLPLGASVGAVIGWAGDAPAMLAAAETALRTAKAQGRGQVAVFTETERAAAQHRRDAVADLRRGLAEDELVLHYQPVIDLETGAPVGVEALVRWQHPQRGLLPPGAFLDVAEDSGLILGVGRTVLRTACRDAASWPVHRGRPLTVAVNLSLRQLAEPGVVGLVAQAMGEARLPAARLVLEVTETAVTHDLTGMTETLLALRELGVRIALDDFGTGYSSLTYLRTFPVGVVKIDRSFVAGVGVDSDDSAIVSSVISLARAVGIDCVAEGVETGEQRDHLCQLGCRYGQGFLWSRPLPQQDLLAWLERQPEVGGAHRPAPVAPPAGQRGPAAPDEVTRRVDQMLRQGASLNTIAAALNGDGLLTEAGARWHPRSVARVIARRPR